MEVTPNLKNDIRRMPGNLMLVECAHIGVADMKSISPDEFLGRKIAIIECQGIDGETIALALTYEACEAFVEGITQAMDNMA